MAPKFSVVNAIEEIIVLILFITFDVYHILVVKFSALNYVQLKTEQVSSSITEALCIGALLTETPFKQYEVLISQILFIDDFSQFVVFYAQATRSRDGVRGPFDECGGLTEASTCNEVSQWSEWSDCNCEFSYRNRKCTSPLEKTCEESCNTVLVEKQTCFKMSEWQIYCAHSVPGKKSSS